jgi:heat shock protein HslJ
MRLFLVALPLLLVLAGCGERSTQPAGDSAPDPLRGKTFLATAVTADGKAHTLVAGTEVSVEFTDDGRLIARAGCNMMQGPVDTTDGKLVVHGGLAMTGMGCDQARHDQDSFVAEVLGASPSWQLKGDLLTITSGATTMELAPREVTNRALVGTTWVLDTQIDGEVASSKPANAPEVALVFEDSRVTADTCNKFGAEYTIEGDQIEFTPGAMTRMACAPEIMWAENVVVDVLNGKTTYEIAEDRLTITNPSGKGIQLHAK